METLLIAFSYSNDIIHQEILSEGQTLNVEFYVTVLKHLLLSIQRVCTEMYRNSKLSLLHGNTCPHIAIHVRNFLERHYVSVTSHPPYTPDRGPATFILFPRLKEVIKTELSQTYQASATSVLRSIPKRDLR